MYWQVQILFVISQTEILINCLFFFSGTYFLLYDFLDYFEKDGPSFLQREKFLEIVQTIFKDFSDIKREAIVFQVKYYLVFFLTIFTLTYLQWYKLIRIPR